MINISDRDRILERKEELDGQVAILFRDFEEETGFSIEHVYIERKLAYIGSAITKVRLKVVLS